MNTFIRVLCTADHKALEKPQELLDEVTQQLVKPDHRIQQADLVAILEIFQYLLIRVFYPVLGLDYTGKHMK